MYESVYSCVHARMHLPSLRYVENSLACQEAVYGCLCITSTFDTFPVCGAFKLDELCIYTDVFFIVIELDHVHLHPGMCISSA